MSTVNNIDNLFLAELPFPEMDPDGELTALIKKFHIYTPCGEINPNALCMVSEKPGDPKVCRHKFSKPYHAETVFPMDGFVKLRRRENRETWKIKLDGDREIEINNRWIAPYNPKLLKKYRCYINVECCVTITAVKYLFKYIHKGHDKIVLDLKNENNQIERYIAGRYLGFTEAVNRINGFKLAHNWFPVYQLPVYKPDRKRLQYDFKRIITGLIDIKTFPLKR